MSAIAGMWGAGQIAGPAAGALKPALPRSSRTISNDGKRRLLRFQRYLIHSALRLLGSSRAPAAPVRTCLALAAL
eukprot:6206737-Pleurochrysis_carterae.AAC.3